MSLALAERDRAPPKTWGSQWALHKATPCKSGYIQRECLVKNKDDF